MPYYYTRRRIPAPDGAPYGKHTRSAPSSPAGRHPVKVRRVDECGSLDEVFLHCLPAFGGAYLRRIYTILDQRHRHGLPADAGHLRAGDRFRPAQAWLIPLLETGWVAYLSTTDAVCYHDGHRSLDASQRSHPRGLDLQRRRRAARRGHHPRHRHGLRRGRAARPGSLHQRRAGAARVSEEDDGNRTALPAGRALRRAGGRRTACAAGLLATCHRLAIPVFVGAPADGSVFLNSMKLWAMRQAGPDAGLRVRSRSARRSVRSLRLSSLGPVRSPGARAGDADPGRRRAQELQSAAGAGAGPGARDCPMSAATTSMCRSSPRRSPMVRSPLARRPKR